MTGGLSWHKPKVTVAPATKPVPVSVTLAPPATEPEGGESAVRVGNGAACGSNAPMLHVTAGRECDRESAEIGESVAVDIQVNNGGWLPVPWILLEDLLPAKALVESRQRLRVKRKRAVITLSP